MNSSKQSGFTTEEYQVWSKESKKNPLPRKKLQLGNKSVEVFALPGYEQYPGRYVYSGESATKVANKHRFQMSQFLRSKSLIALPHKDFKCHIFGAEGSKRGISGYPSQMVFDFWLYELSCGNLEVLPAISALGSTSLDLLADRAFDIDRQAQDYERLIRERLFTTEAVEYKLHFYPEYYDELYRIFQRQPSKRGKPPIFGKITREYFYDLFPGKANDIFDERNPYREWYNHQFLTGDGNKIFSQIMNSFLTFLRGCPPGNLKTFAVQYQNVYGRGFQCELSI